MTTDDERKLIATAFFKILSEIAKEHLKTEAYFVDVNVKVVPILPADRNHPDASSRRQDFDEEVDRFLCLGKQNGPEERAAATQALYGKELN